MVAMMLNSPTVAGAELNVLMSGGFGGAYEKLLPEFERTSGVKVTNSIGRVAGERSADNRRSARTWRTRRRGDPVQGRSHRTDRRQ